MQKRNVSHPFFCIVQVEHVFVYVHAHSVLCCGSVLNTKRENYRQLGKISHIDLPGLKRRIQYDSN